MREISRMAVDGVPSSASRCISFRATISFVVLERPFHGFSVCYHSIQDTETYLVHSGVGSLTCVVDISIRIQGIGNMCHSSPSFSSYTMTVSEYPADDLSGKDETNLHVIHLDTLAILQKGVVEVEDEGQSPMAAISGTNGSLWRRVQNNRWWLRRTSAWTLTCTCPGLTVDAR